MQFDQKWDRKLFGWPLRVSQRDSSCSVSFHDWIIHLFSILLSLDSISNPLWWWCSSLERLVKRVNQEKPQRMMTMQGDLRRTIKMIKKFLSWSCRGNQKPYLFFQRKNQSPKSDVCVFLLFFFLLEKVSPVDDDDDDDVQALKSLTRWWLRESVCRRDWLDSESDNLEKFVQNMWSYFFRSFVSFRISFIKIKVDILACSWMCSSVMCVLRHPKSGQHYIFAHIFSSHFIHENRRHWDSSVKLIWNVKFLEWSRSVRRLVLLLQRWLSYLQMYLQISEIERRGWRRRQIFLSFNRYSSVPERFLWMNFLLDVEATGSNFLPHSREISSRNPLFKSVSRKTLSSAKKGRSRCLDDDEVYGRRWEVERFQE